MIVTCPYSSTRPISMKFGIRCFALEVSQQLQCFLNGWKNLTGLSRVLTGVQPEDTVVMRYVQCDQLTDHTSAFPVTERR